MVLFSLYVFLRAPVRVRSKMRARRTVNSHEILVSGTADHTVEHISHTEDVESLHLFWPRVSVLASLLLFQSISSFILEGFYDLFTNHTMILAFLTMIVGLGGNVGGQSVVLVVRDTAMGRTTDWVHQLKVAVGICVVIVPVVILRVNFSRSDVDMVCLFTITLSCALIVFFGTALGTFSPLLLQRMRIDPAHAAPFIQVAMDIIGVSIVCVIGASMM